MTEFTSFTYSKLTLLQVQGARDRSCRRVELSQCVRRLESVRLKWRNQMSRCSEYANESQELFLRAILSEFTDRDMSPFMVERLVKLCRAEYRANEAWEHALDRVKTYCDDDIEWWKRQLQHEQSNKLEAIRELQFKILKTQRDLERIRLQQKIEDLRSRLQELKRGDLVGKEETSIHTRRHSIGSDGNDCSYFIPRGIGESSSSPNKSQHPEDGDKQARDWIDIDDDYFCAQSEEVGSDWVLCS